MLRIVGKAIGLDLGQAATSLPFENVQQITPTEAIESLELACRHECGERFSPALNDELISPKGYPIEQLPKTLPDL
jgi:hypothetical protein